MIVRGKLAKVIPPYEAAFNVGSDKGVKVDDIAIAYDNIDVHDPDSNELLGTLERAIVRFRVYAVAEAFSAGTVLDTFRNPASPSRILDPSQRPPARLRKRITDDPSREGETTAFVPIGCLVKFETPEPPKSDDDLPF